MTADIDDKQSSADRLPLLETRSLNIPSRQSQLHMSAPSPRLVSESDLMNSHRPLGLKQISLDPVVPDAAPVRTDVRAGVDKLEYFNQSENNKEPLYLKSDIKSDQNSRKISKRFVCIFIPLFVVSSYGIWLYFFNH